MFFKKFPNFFPQTVFLLKKPNPPAAASQEPAPRPPPPLRPGPAQPPRSYAPRSEVREMKVWLLLGLLLVHEALEDGK